LAAIRFIVAFELPLCPRRRVALSAKWRRSKKHSRKFSILKAFGRTKEKKNTPRVFRVKNVGPRKQRYSHSYELPKSYDRTKLREPEPLIDVLEEKDEIVVIAEFAGFDNEHLRVDVKDMRLVLTAQAGDRKYYKSLNLPSRVIPKAIHLKRRNGVLEIRLTKTIEEKTMDKVAG
jgi:HSP20 family molecular chaperone IbpA